MHRYALLWTLLLVARTQLLQAQAPTPRVDFRALDQFVEEVMKEWHVPGLALGVIQDGSPVLLKGYGFRDLERRLPVTPRTLMAIGSNSKSFTVVLMGMLVDSGKLAWDQPVRTYLPDFQLHDPFATQEMTPRDLVVHRSGLPRHDALWYGRSFDREELYRRLKFLEPSASFRSRWQYQNLMFLTAGYLVERISGRTWDDLVKERIFAPLEMKRSNTSVRDLKPESDDAAVAYVWRACPETATGASTSRPDSPQCGLVRVPYRNIDAVGPAGSINSSVEEMLHYIQFHIDSGAYRGRQLLSKANAREMQTPQMLVGTQEIWPDELGMATYGLGLSITTYRGRKLVQHGGGIDGFISQMSWMPRERIGVMVLTNQSGNNPVPNIVTRRVFDLMLGLDPIDWVARVKEQEREARERSEQQRKEREAQRKTGTLPSQPLESYTGQYQHKGYGTLTVRLEGQNLVLVLDDFTAPLKHYHYDVFEIDDPLNLVPLSGLVTFSMDKKGEIDRVAVPLEPNVSDIVFTRVK
jgi:CubicO group peptidase (beta-lactamase class C family)